jgi:hypothetical protein
VAALIRGRADPAAMAELARGRMRTKLPLLEQALTGGVRAHHRQWLAIQLAHIDFLDEQLASLSTEITHCLTDLSSVAPQRHWPRVLERWGAGRSPARP